ncbi:MAG: exonuclease domain-containing protein [Gammaproteobacteria bacterium]|nr:exonuclease domain-containing protein [Gammaproteobacteria bacterium]
MKKTFLFYDIETTGLSKPFDQILQFAAIRTDLALNEIERHECRVRLNKDIFPAPGALLTHGLGIREIQEGISEYEAIQKIHQWMNVPGTISLGYNTLGFDDEFLRFGFYRHLLKPYTHQYANGCGRMDLYPITLMFYLFKPAILNWREVNGRKSLKLEYINQANQFAKGAAHDAMVDVEVTLALAKHLMTESTMWEYLCGYFQKEIDLTRMQPLQKDMALLIQGRIGTEANYQCPVMFLGQHKHYRNQFVWLRLDSETLQQTTLETINTCTFSFNKKPGEPNFILPMTERFLTQIDSARITLAQNNQRWLKENPKIFQAITDWHLNFTYPVFPNVDYDARLYLNGFFSRDEDFFCERFQKSTPKEKAKLAESAQSDLLQTLTTRLIGRHFPEALTSSLEDRFAEYLAAVKTPEDSKILIDHQGRKRLTPHLALAEIATLRAEPEKEKTQLKLLEEYEAYLQKLS